MFEEREAIAVAVEAVYALTTELRRGQVLTHEAVQSVLGVPPGAHPWNLVLRKVERRLEAERGIAFWPNFRDGKLLCTVEQQLRLPGERLKRAGRQARKGRRAAEAIPERALTVHQRRARAFLVASNRDAEHAIRRERKALDEQCRGPERLPRRPVN